jgi:lipoate-protein ligase A
MAPDALAWDLVIARKSLGTQLDRAAAAIGGALAAGLARLGLPARYRPENEIEIAGRKVCGLSGYFDGGTLVYQGTILVDTSLAEMARYLNVPGARAASSRSDLERRLITVAGCLGRRPDHNEIVDAMAAELSRSLGRSDVRDRLSAEELELADERYRDEFGLDSFVAGDTSSSSAPAARTPRAAALQPVQSP